MIYLQKSCINPYFWWNQYSSDLASRTDSDSNISRDEVFQIIKHIYDLDLQWKGEEVLGAWTKTRSAKNDKCSVQSREKVKLLE